jgi:flagellar biosynthesis/type III secretory pathway chaperone
VDQSISKVYNLLQKLMGLHCQLLEVVRSERETLIQADLKGIENITCAKQVLIENIHQIELQRLKLTAELAVQWKKPYRELTLPNIIIAIQGIDPKSAEQFRSIYNALTVLIQRISDQNIDNRGLIERSLEHVNQMKKNVLGESSSKSNIYTPQGHKASGSQTSRLISKEA